MKRKAKVSNDKALFECQYVAALKEVDAYFNNEAKSEIWMQTLNPLLGGVSPIYMLEVGRFDKLQTFIYTQLSENKA